MPNYCTNCGETLADAERVLDYVTQVVSIPELKPVIKEIRHYVMICRSVVSVYALHQDASLMMLFMMQA